MNQVIKFDLIQRQLTLRNWLADCKREIALKFPKIDFESDHWPIKTLYRTSQKDWYFTEAFADFEGRDQSFCDVIRCIVAEIVIRGVPMSIDQRITGIRLLKDSAAQSIFAITLSDIRRIEDDCLRRAQVNNYSASRELTRLSILQIQIQRSVEKGVIPRIGFRVRRETKCAINNIIKSHRSKISNEKNTTLDRKIEAFNEALNALSENDPRLDSADMVSIALITRMMCAPSRVNEIMCSAIDDHVTVEDYAQWPEDKERDTRHRTHQMLLVTMKGSKGAQWSAKPALNFMIDAFNYTTDLIKQYGQRSRMLVEWYEKYPTKIYLPPEIEYLRGKDVNRINLAKIINLTDKPKNGQQKASSKTYFDELKNKQFKGVNPTTRLTDQAKYRRSQIQLLSWEDIEKLLLEKVNQALENCRKVTPSNYYEGKLSKMLFLFDREETPFQPWAVNYKFILNRLKRTASSTRIKQPTIFDKLGITIPVNGKVQVAEIDTHDPRRWLTTMAMRHGENLSDVLINKWANRLSLAQLKAYDLRTAEELATFSRMPQSDELTDISNGIEQSKKQENEFGLKSDIVTVHGAGISVTSMERIVQAVEDRPIARTSNQIIIIYPSLFGGCLHQHHEAPCAQYKSCLPCDNNFVVKGHIPTNDNIRKRDEDLLKSIVRQLERLMYEHNRGIADDPESLIAHMLQLVERGLSPHQMANYLIDEFHEIKQLINDKLLANRLEEAFVARGYVKRLDNMDISCGALMKYHNPTYHASPGLEKALDEHGGIEQIEHDEQKLIEKYPQFSPRALSLKDERYLLEADDDDGEED